MKTYDMSKKRKLTDLKQTDWDYRIKVITLKNQGLSVNEIARKLVKSPQNIFRIIRLMRGMTVEQAEQIANSLD